MVEDEDITANQLGNVIERDQVLTSKLLKMVNSSFYGFPQRISTVANAIVLLGINVIKTLIVTSSIFEMMQSSDVGLWEHSLGCATIASLIAKKKGLKNPEEVSTAALLHDLGKVVVRAELPSEYDALLALVEQKGISMREAEEELLGVSHSEIGGWLVPRTVEIWASTTTRIVLQIEGIAINTRRPLELTVQAPAGQKESDLAETLKAGKLLE
jgi:HD-like signal output (HDOD) protein